MRYANQPLVEVPPTDPPSRSALWRPSHLGWKRLCSLRRQSVDDRCLADERIQALACEATGIGIVRKTGKCQSRVWRSWGVLGVLIMASASTFAGSAPDVWETLKGKHFIVSHQENAVFAAEVLRRAELYYDSIVQQLGFKRVDNFWLWERRATIRIYASRREFLEATQAPEWAAAKASFKTRTIESFGDSAAFLQSRLPHEMAHLIFREYIGFKNAVPLWLDEGVAQWCERGGNLPPPLLREWIPLRVLTSMNVHAVRDGRKARLFYSESASVVQYLVQRYGQQKFTKFCRQLRDGKTLDGALRFTYPKAISTMEALEQQWSAWQLTRSDRDI